MSQAAVLNTFETILTMDYGTRFFKADLHFHTPASADARGSKLKEAGFRIDEWGVVAATGRTSVYNTIEFVTRRGGIVIPAHIDGSDQALLRLFKW